MNQELYMLVAKRNGMYLCKHCPNGNFFLYAGQLYRYGITGNEKEGRGYTNNWEHSNQLIYLTIYQGDLATVKMMEIDLIGKYALHPENLERPLLGEEKAKKYWYRLVLPPGNNRLD